MPRGSIYVTLDRLEDKGLLSSTEGAVSAARGQRPKRLFTVTPHGMKAVKHSLLVLSRMQRGLEGVLGTAMSGWIWRRTERILSAHVPAARLPALLGDLAEDYAGQRAAKGYWRSAAWLIRETRSLARAYRAARKATFTPRARYLSCDEFVHAWRALRGRPGTPALCALLLALGIGLVTAMFSVVDSMMLRPVPFPIRTAWFDRASGASNRRSWRRGTRVDCSSRLKRSTKQLLCWTARRVFDCRVRSSRRAFFRCWEPLPGTDGPLPDGSRRAPPVPR